MPQSTSQQAERSTAVEGARLQGQVAIVTGAGRGIGRAIALAIGSAGALVACISRTEAEILSVASEINSISGLNNPSYERAIAIQYDVTDIGGIQTLVADIENRLGPITILVNNAGIARIDALDCNPDITAWQQVITTNLTSPSAFMCSVLPSMLSNGRGTVISIGSRNAAFDIPYTCAYSVAKTGLLKLHQNIEAEIGGRGVYSYYLQPGNVDTDILDRPGAVDETSLRHHEDVCHAIETVQRKAKRPSEFVAEACVMLITDADSRLLSGLYVDLDQDVNRILDDLRKGENGECAKRSLYKLKISSLQP